MDNDKYFTRIGWNKGMWKSFLQKSVFPTPWELNAQEGYHASSTDVCGFEMTKTAQWLLCCCLETADHPTELSMFWLHLFTVHIMSTCLPVSSAHLYCIHSFIHQLLSIPYCMPAGLLWWKWQLWVFIQVYHIICLEFRKHNTKTAKKIYKWNRILK
jgi:hypothetical protein